MRRCNPVGYIHSLDTYSTLDGYGIRSVVFLQGCHLRCMICHNPDTWDKTNGRQMTADEVVKKLSNYKTYYGDSGGVTFSGGEPLLQSEFVLECIKRLKDISVKSAIETSGNVKIDDTIAEILRNLDFVICDIKYATNEDYKAYVLGSLNYTIDFLDYLQRNNIPTWVRTVVVPSISDNEEYLTKVQDIVSRHDNIFRWELLPFSKLGFHKYTELGVENRCVNLPDLDMSRFNILKEKFEFEKKLK